MVWIKELIVSLDTGPIVDGGLIDKLATYQS